ncbi:hypothetical protein [Roseicella aerolata]|uniref:Uncharacterized protein n=1 Tax=Roseicella aerolata TaxID=2883479 RepID=A0A9X1L9Y2_9PROT|nr:hypothetical protein [Roseicella aerolata]MCB4820882.1 hypothetical protein [Roseicella aerolata]
MWTPLRPLRILGDAMCGSPYTHLIAIFDGSPGEADFLLAAAPILAGEEGLRAEVARESRHGLLAGPEEDFRRFTEAEVWERCRTYRVVVTADCQMPKGLPEGAEAVYDDPNFLYFVVRDGRVAWGERLGPDTGPGSP